MNEGYNEWMLHNLTDLFTEHIADCITKQISETNWLSSLFLFLHDEQMFQQPRRRKETASSTSFLQKFLSVRSSSLQDEYWASQDENIT